MVGWRLGVLGAALTLAACYGTNGDDDGNGDGDAGAGGSSGSAGSGGSGNATGSGGSAATGGVAAAGGGGGSSGAAGSGGASAAGGSGGGAGSSGSAGSDTRGSGQVTLLTLVNYPTPGAGLTSLSATFQRAGSPACPVTEYGPCSISDCDPASEGDPVDAGTITATSAEVAFAHAIAPIDGVYTSYSEADSVFLGEESISIAATGGVVPAFQTTLRYPLLLLLTAPPLGEGQRIVPVPRGQDLTLSWDRGATDVLFQAQSSSSSGPSLVCTAPSETGSMVIPSAAMTALPSGTPVDLFTIGRVPVSTGDYDVIVVAAGVVVAPDKARRIELLLE